LKITATFIDIILMY